MASGRADARDRAGGLQRATACRLSPVQVVSASARAYCYLARYRRRVRKLQKDVFTELGSRHRGEQKPTPVDRPFGAREQRERTLDAVDTRMRNRNAVAERGRSDELSSPQRPEYRCRPQPAHASDRRGGPLERMPAIVQFDVEHDLLRLVT